MSTTDSEYERYLAHGLLPYKHVVLERMRDIMRVAERCRRSNTQVHSAWMRELRRSATTLVLNWDKLIPDLVYNGAGLALLTFDSDDGVFFAVCMWTVHPSRRHLIFQDYVAGVKMNGYFLHRGTLFYQAVGGPLTVMEE